MKMNDYIELINKNLDNFLQIEEPQSLFKSMKYTLMLPGKRLRPILCLETCIMLGGNVEDAIAAMSHTTTTFIPNEVASQQYKYLYKKVYLKMFPQLKDVYKDINIFAKKHK